MRSKRIIFSHILYDFFIGTFVLQGLPENQRLDYLDRTREYAAQEGVDINAVFLVDLPDLLTQIKMR